jgi:hypothetical protein
MNNLFLKIKYKIFGYVIFKGSEDPKITRDKISNDTKDTAKFIYGFDFYKKNYQLYLNDPKIISYCEILFGKDFKFSNGGTVHHGHYGVQKKGNRLIPGAHIDSDYQYHKKEKELCKLSYQVAKIGIYLQSSEQKLNILAIPFTHLLSRLLAILRLNKLILIFLRWSSIIFSFEVLRKFFRIKIEPGDIVIFDCQLIHASDVGESDLKKFVIYSEVGNRISMINFHFNNVVPRAQLEKSDPNTSEIYLRDPNRYNIQKELYDGEINSFNNVLRNLRNQ